MRFLVVAAALAFVSAPAVAQAQAPKSAPARSAVELSLDWGAWTQLEVGDTLTEARATVQEAVGVPLAPVAGGTDSILQTYEARYTRDKVSVVEQVDILKSSGRIAGFSIRLPSPVGCEGLIAALTEGLGAPQSQTVSTNGTTYNALVWANTDYDERIIVRVRAGAKARLCDMVSTTPDKRTFR